MDPNRASLKSFVRISALLWADVLVLYAMFVMQNYLTDVWEISITHAAGIINIWNGISMILPVFFLFFVDAFLGHFKMLVLSSVAYTVGISFVAMSTPPVLGRCNEYERECISHAQKVLFYIGMALLAVGIAGHLVSIKPFLEEQQEENNGTESNMICLQIPGLIVVVLIPIIAAIALPYIKPWSIRFGIPAIFTLVSTLLFLSGVFWYPYNKRDPQGSPITNICRVFVAFAFKISQSFPLNDRELHRINERESFTYTYFLRGLGKAAIILPGEISPITGQVRSRWKLCAISEVEEAKIAVRMVPMWMTFIVCGIVSSFGNTYFIEQASNMNRKIGAWKVPLPVLLLLSQWVKNFLGGIADKYLLKKSNDPNTPQYPENKYCRPPVGIGIAMIFSILCCITAAKIEKKRLNVIRKHDLLDKPDEDIPMSIYWLLFQYFLLAGLDSFIEKSVAAFYSYQAPKSMAKYLQYFCKGVFGLGFMSNVLSVYVVGKISGKGGKTNWFQFTLNRSRLDRYYWVLAALSSANLMAFILVASFYRYKKIEWPTEEVEVGIDGVEGEPPEDHEEADQ